MTNAGLITGKKQPFPLPYLDTPILREKKCVPPLWPSISARSSADIRKDKVSIFGLACSLVLLIWIEY